MSGGIPIGTGGGFGTGITGDFHRNTHLLSGGHVEALRAHAGNSWFIHLDIKDFFGSINRSRITRALKNLFGYEQARSIANASTVIHPSRGDYILPFGFVQSPLIASVCLYKSALGRCLRDLQKTGVTVSIYVDDLILSTADLQVVQQALVAVKRAAERAEFRLNPAKEEGPAEKVTAFNIAIAAVVAPTASHRLISAINPEIPAHIAAQRDFYSTPSIWVETGNGQVRFNFPDFREVQISESAIEISGAVGRPEVSIGCGTANSRHRKASCEAGKAPVTG